VPAASDGGSNAARPLVSLAAAQGFASPRALYIHYPFCVHRCHYCDFSVKRSSDPPFEEWLAALETDLTWWFAVTGWPRRLPLDSIFVGGGTPSLVPESGPAALAAVLSERFVLDGLLEWTVESNPVSLTERVAEAWRVAGATRLSVGVQAFDDLTLRWLGRLHDRETAEQALRIAGAAGFERLSVDLLFGLPGEVERSLDREIDQLLEHDVDHVSAYGLTVEPRTPLARWVELGRVTPAGGEAYETEYRTISGRLIDAGFGHYEVSNFARPGQECRHNWYYWNRSPYLGLGPSSHGFFPPLRVWNTFRWDRYRKVLEAGAGPVESWEKLDEADVALERLWLGLRTRKGIEADDATWRDAVGRRLPEWIDQGWVRLEAGRVMATTDGWLRLDELVTEIGGGVREAPLIEGGHKN